VPINVDCPECGKRLKAPDSMAGKKAKCPKCSAVVRIPDDVVDAEAIGAAAPSDDEYALMDAAIKAERAAPEIETRKPCPACGEMIMNSAVKCRFCGEIFDETLKKSEAKKNRRAAASDEDSDLTTGDWVFCILCSGIACIAGIVYMIQGKPKGIKMVGISFGMQIFWGIVRLIIEAATGGLENP
jgi:DNA-directed RNA polymerase subunit M/transcription elongation factor TFIIS